MNKLTIRVGNRKKEKRESNIVKRRGRNKRRKNSQYNEKIRENGVQGKCKNREKCVWMIEE